MSVTIWSLELDPTNTNTPTDSAVGEDTMALLEDAIVTLPESPPRDTLERLVRRANPNYKLLPRTTRRYRLKVRKTKRTN